MKRLALVLLILFASFLITCTPAEQPMRGEDQFGDMFKGQVLLRTFCYIDADNDTFGDKNDSNPVRVEPNESCPSGTTKGANTDCDDNELTGGSKWQEGTFYIDRDGDGYVVEGSEATLCYGSGPPETYYITEAEKNFGYDCADEEVTDNGGNTIDPATI